MPFRRKRNRVSVKNNNTGEVLSRRSDAKSGTANKTRTTIFGRIFHFLFRICSLRKKRNNDSCTEGEEAPNATEEPSGDSSLYDALRSDTQTTLPNIQELYEGSKVANSTNDDEVHDDEVQAPVRDDIQVNESLNELPSIRKNLVLTSMCDSSGSDLTSLPSVEEVDMFNNIVASYHQCKTHNERDKLSEMKLAKTFTSSTKPLIKITESVSCDNVNESKSNTSAEKKILTSSKSINVMDVSDKDVEAKLPTLEIAKVTPISKALTKSATTSMKRTKTAIMNKNDGTKEQKTVNNDNKNNASNVNSSSKTPPALEIAKITPVSKALTKSATTSTKKTRTDITNKNDGTNEQKTVNNDNKNNASNVTSSSKTSPALEIAKITPVSKALTKSVTTSTKKTRTAIMNKNDGTKEQKTVKNDNKNNASNVISSSKTSKKTKAATTEKVKQDSTKSQNDGNNNATTGTARVTADKQNTAGASKKCLIAPKIAAKTTTLVKQNGTLDNNGTKSGKWSWMETKQFKSLNSILTRKLKKVPMTSLVPVVVNGVSVHLGNGAYGSVDLMKLTSRHGEVRAAVKTIKQPTTKVTLSKKERVMERALMEAQCLHLLSASRVFPKVYGICYPKVHEIKIIMEFIGRGNNSIELTDAMLDPNGIKAGISWLRITKDITCGLDFMHRKGLLHNDLAPRNILLTSEQRWCAKIIDLGMVSSINAPSTRAYDFCDTPENIEYQKEKWPEIAPEFLEQEDQPETKASDVYSLGMIFGKIGYAKKIPGLQEIAMNMVVRDPNCRSSTSVVLKRLNRLISVELKGRSVRVSGKGSNVALHKFFKKV